MQTVAVRRSVIALTFLLAALSVAGGFLAGPRAWGMNLWSAFPTGGFITALLILIAAMTPWGRKAGVRSLGPLAASLEDRRRVRLIASAAIALFAAAFWFGRERTYFLSDGELLIRGIEQKLKGSFEADLLSFQIQAWLHDLFHHVLHVPSLTASFRLVSIVSGIAWLGSSFATVGRLASRGWQRLLLAGLLATLGFTRLFYGYVETSPLLAAATALYLWRAVVFMKTGRGAASVSISLVAAIAMHMAGVLLVPSWLFIIATASSREARRLLLLVGGLPLVVAAGLLMVRTGHGGASATRLADYFSNFLPVAGPIGSKHAYHLFSPDHWNDFFQQQFLLGPFALIAVVVILATMAFSGRGDVSAAAEESGAQGTGAEQPPQTPGAYEGRVSAGAPTPDDARGPTSIEIFLLCQIVPVTLAAFFYGRKLGAARDWDLLAGAAPAAALWVGLIVMRAWNTPPERQRGRREEASAAAPGAPFGLDLRQISVLIFAVSLFNLVPWILVDSAPARSIRRFETLVSADAPLSRFARAYDYEELGRYHFERGDLMAAKDWFARAVETDPHDAKALVPLSHTLKFIGNARFAAGQYAAADSAYEAALVHDPDSVELILNRGLARESLGDTSAALRFYLKAISLDGNNKAATFAAGTLHLRNGNPARALPLLETARRLDPAAMEPAVNLALAQAYLGQASAARATLESIPGVDSRVVHACMDAAMILSGQGRTAEALGLLASCRARSEELARSNGLIQMMETIRK